MRRVRLLPALLAVATGAAPSPEQPVVIRVMTFNVWHGGALVDFRGVVAAVRAAGADVVGLQEAEGNTRMLADSLGWKYADPRHQIISRLPVIDPSGADGIYLLVEPRPGRVVAIANLHLTSDPYGPEAVRDGAGPDSVVALERAVRLPEIRRHLEVLPRLAAAGIPVILTGDFNSPSPQDWTRQMVKARPQVRYPLAWPVAVAVERAGFRDSYREVHPDPVRRPGLTWTPGYPPPSVPATETLDRIDFVYAAGRAEPLESRIVGEIGGPDVDLEVSPWPSDHRAVVSTFRVVPGPPPIYVAVARRVVRVGDSLEVRSYAPGRKARLAIRPADIDLTPGDPAPARSVGLAVFATGRLRPGDYEAVLLDSAGPPLARTRFTLLGRDAVPEVEVRRRASQGTEPIDVRWRNAPGNRWDWVGVYRAGETVPGNHLIWKHTGATISGSARLEPDDFPAPLAPGRYEVRLMEDDGYDLLASAEFVVTP